MTLWYYPTPGAGSVSEGSSYFRRLRFRLLLPADRRIHHVRPQDVLDAGRHLAALVLVLVHEHQRRARPRPDLQHLTREVEVRRTSLEPLVVEVDQEGELALLAVVAAVGAVAV